MKTIFICPKCKLEINAFYQKTKNECICWFECNNCGYKTIPIECASYERPENVAGYFNIIIKKEV